MKRKYAFMVDLGDGLFGGKAYALSTNKRAAKRQFAYGAWGETRVHVDMSEIKRIPVRDLRAAIQ